MHEGKIELSSEWRARARVSMQQLEGAMTKTTERKSGSIQRRSAPSRRRWGARKKEREGGRKGGKMEEEAEEGSKKEGRKEEHVGRGGLLIRLNW